MHKYVILNYRRLEEIVEAVDNCCVLFKQDTEKMIIIDGIGVTLTNMVSEGTNLNIPAVNDMKYIKSMGKSFNISYEKDKEIVISLVNFILEIADKVYQEDNPANCTKHILKKYCLN